MASASGCAGSFSDAYSRLLKEFAEQIGERPGAYGQAGRSVREEIVRCIWFGAHFPPDELTTDDGRRVEVVSPGWWNVEGGPDFVRAEFLLEGSGRVVGDVEVHTVASGWRAHGHHLQPEYNDVALHVVMWNDRPQQAATTADDRQIPQITLSRFVEEDMEGLVDLVEPERQKTEDDWTAVEGRFCGAALREGQLQPEWLGRLLDAAGDHRVLNRARGLAELLQNHSRDQVLYERIAEALGYKNNRMPFMQLAGLLPMRELRASVPPGCSQRDAALRIEAAMFRAAGFLADEGADWDDEARQYRARLLRACSLPGMPPDEVTLSREHWRFGGTRPVNYPGRRIAALALLCAENLADGLFARFLRVMNATQPAPRQRLDTALRAALIEELTRLQHPYWSHHYKLGGPRTAAARALVGASRGTKIVVDVLIPLLLAHAQVTGDEQLTVRLHALWRGMPRQPDNTVTRRMESVMFGGRDQARAVVHSLRRQQGLHQVHRDCCRGEGGCTGCVVYLAHRSGRRLAAL